LDADAIGILEQHRVVARRELRSLLGRMDDARSELVDEKAIDRIDVRAAAGAKAEMMQAGTVLVELPVALLRRRATHQNAGAAADAVDDVRTLDQRLHRHEVAEALPERHAARGIVHRQLNVGDAVDLNAHTALLLSGLAPRLRASAVSSFTPAFARRWQHG